MSGHSTGDHAADAESVTIRSAPSMNHAGKAGEDEEVGEPGRKSCALDTHGRDGTQAKDQRIVRRDVDKVAQKGDPHGGTGLPETLQEGVVGPEPEHAEQTGYPEHQVPVPEPADVFAQPGEPKQGLRIEEREPGLLRDNLASSVLYSRKSSVPLRHSEHREPYPLADTERIDRVSGRTKAGRRRSCPDLE